MSSKDLVVSKPELRSVILEADGKMQVVRVSTKSFAHAVYFELPEGATPSDNYFDLLPGESRDIKIYYTDGKIPEKINVNCVTI